MADMKLEIPQDIILSVVKAQVIAALGKSETLIAGVVEAALSAKKDQYSSTPTIFIEQTSAMIREVAVETFKEWLKENRDKVQAEMRRQLTAQKGKVLTDLVDGFTKDLVNIYPRITLDFRERG